ncbi:hypothetical protein E3N88_35873 [Mikania micrantha]|uniref:F-box domain-containing protein n=1 Tax=Mikania micrantha TaxID=192012 RepID=A0A5N6M4Z4_9ASTR|nr:hypothetical protein E3N88_35873 [Mikania micrantha]
MISTAMEARNPHKKTETETVALEPQKKMETKADIDDVLTLCLIESEILTRLPAKSVGRFKCVCKQWKSFLSTPTFVRTHLHYHRTINDHKLLLADGATLRKVPFTDTIPSNPNPNPSGAHAKVLLLLASLDGLVLLASITQEGPTELVFLNPLTGAFRKLSPFFEPDPNDIFGFTHFYDVMGFYKDDSCNDYKLVYLIAGGDLGAYIYSHRLDTWREIDSSFAFRKTETNSGFCIWFVLITRFAGQATPHGSARVSAAGFVTCYRLRFVKVVWSSAMAKLPHEPRAHHPTTSLAAVLISELCSSSRVVCGCVCPARGGSAGHVGCSNYMG